VGAQRRGRELSAMTRCRRRDAVSLSRRPRDAGPVAPVTGRRAGIGVAAERRHDPAGDPARSAIYADPEGTTRRAVRRPGLYGSAARRFVGGVAGVLLAQDRSGADNRPGDDSEYARTRAALGDGLGQTYLQGALERALDRRPDVQRARRVARAERERAYALTEAEIYAAAAASVLRQLGRGSPRRPKLSRRARQALSKAVVGR
jgi:hypothetical protein